MERMTGAELKAILDGAGIKPAALARYINRTEGYLHGLLQKSRLHEPLPEALEPRIRQALLEIAGTLEDALST